MVFYGVFMVLDVELLKLMQFNDLHLSYTFTGSFARLTQIYMKNVNMWMEY